MLQWIIFPRLTNILSDVHHNKRLTQYLRHNSYLLRAQQKHGLKNIKAFAHNRAIGLHHPYVDSVSRVHHARRGHLQLFGSIERTQTAQQADIMQWRRLSAIVHYEHDYTLPASQSVISMRIRTAVSDCTFHYDTLHTHRATGQSVC